MLLLVISFSFHAEPRKINNIFTFWYDLHISSRLIYAIFFEGLREVSFELINHQIDVLYKMYYTFLNLFYMSDQITIQDPCMHPNVQFRKMLMHLFKFPCIKISSVVVRKTKLEIRATWVHLSLTLILPSFLLSEIILKSSNTVCWGSSEIQRDLCFRDQWTKSGTSGSRNFWKFLTNSDQNQLFSKWSDQLASIPWDDPCIPALCE